MRASGPDLLTYARFPLAAAMIAASLASPHALRPVIACLFALGVVTDMVDGPLARRLDVASDRGARLDSAGDAALTVAASVCLVRGVDLALEPWATWAIVAIASLRLAALAVTYVRFRLVSIAHTWANKGTGAALAATAVYALASGDLGTWAIACAVAVAAPAALEELLMVASARAYCRDRRGIWDRRSAPDRTSRRHEINLAS